MTAHALLAKPGDVGGRPTPSVLVPTAAGAGSTTPARKVAAAFLGLLAAYVVLSLLNDPRGTLGSDTGPKLATMRAMDEHGAFDPDIGYWAERFDPDGSLHPLYNTARVGDGWVNVTTVPMLYVARPLYEVGGIRAALILPMLGAALSALAARALARRTGGGNGWWAFWGVGIATPLAIYALDFWEHALGVAAVAWAVVFALDVIEGRTEWRGALVTGLLFGAAATMRSEALVYALVATLVVCGVRVARTRRVVAAVHLGGAILGGLVAVLVANDLLERLTIGAGLRGGRTSAAAGGVGSGLVERAREAFETTFAVASSSRSSELVLGALVALVVGFAAWACTRSDARTRRLGRVALTAAVVIYAARFAGLGLGFVRGMLAASPLAVVGLALGARRNGVSRWSVLIAVAALPLVWVVQYSGVGPQWGGRYVLATGTLLAVAGIVALAAHGRATVTAFVALGVLVSAGGVAWLSVRSHSVADAMTALEARHDEAVISREGLFFREGGAFYDADDRWLTARSSRQVRQAFRVVERAGLREVAFVREAESVGLPATPNGFVRGRTEEIELYPDVPLSVTTYTRR